MDGADRQLPFGQLDDEGHDEVVAARRAVRFGPPFGLVGESGLVAVVPVGDHHGSGLHGAHDLFDHRRGVDDPELVQDPVVVDGLRVGRAVGLIGGGQAP